MLAKTQTMAAETSGNTRCTLQQLEVSTKADQSSWVCDCPIGMFGYQVSKVQVVLGVGKQ